MSSLFFCIENSRVLSDFFIFALMMRIIAIILSFVMVSESTGIGLSDVLKIEYLVEHMAFHQEKYGDTAWEFLLEHYVVDAEHEHHDTDEHHKLPFQQVSACSCIMYFEDINFNYISNKLILTPEKKHNFFYKNLYTSLEGDQLLQPPRFA